MKKRSDLLKNLHHTISSCSKKNRKMFEEELESMSKKIEEMVKGELSSLDPTPDIEILNRPLEKIVEQVSQLQETVEKSVSTLSLEANKALSEIFESFHTLEEVKRRIIQQTHSNISKMVGTRKKVLRSLREDKNLIRKSIKRYKWVDL